MNAADTYENRYFFPISTLNVYGGGMSCFRACPTSDPCVSIMEFDYYHQGSDEEFEEYFNFVRQVALEDFELCEKSQSNLEKGVYGEGILNPKKENGVAFYQQQVRKMIYDQVALEDEVTKTLAGGESSEGAMVSDLGLQGQGLVISVL
jgi:Ring hydroxylating alpha subunit (catalytic domain)